VSPVELTDERWDWGGVEPSQFIPTARKAWPSIKHSIVSKLKLSATRYQSRAMPDYSVTSGTGLTLKPESDAGLTQWNTGKTADAELLQAFQYLQPRSPGFPLACVLSWKNVQGIFLDFASTSSDVPHILTSLIFHGVRRCWDQTQDVRRSYD
jgi:hypothetical protein